MPDELPVFPYAPYSIVNDKGMVNTAPTPKGVATVENSRKLAKDITKLVRMKHPKMKVPKARKKQDIRYY